MRVTNSIDGAGLPRHLTMMDQLCSIVVSSQGFDMACQGSVFGEVIVSICSD